MARDLEKYLRPGLSTAFCPGCGHGILMGLILRAIDDLKLDFNNMLFVSGIGCGGWIPSPNYNADTLHTLHGRTLPFATGAKMFNPKLKVMVISGDGDLADIGGNHLIHAARRNIDVTVVCANNFLYGMTGGQGCSTTPFGAYTMTTTEGNPYHPFDICKLVSAAGASYVARYAVTQPFMLVDSIKKALQTKGFSFVEAICACPTQYGRRNLMSTPAEMAEYLMKNVIDLETAESLKPEERKDKILTGEYTNGRK